MLGATLANQWQNKYNIFATGKKNFKNNKIENFLEFDLK